MSLSYSCDDLSQSVSDFDGCTGCTGCTGSQELTGGAIMGGMQRSLGGCMGCPMCGGFISPNDFSSAHVGLDDDDFLNNEDLNDVKRTIKYYKLVGNASKVRSLNNVLKNIKKGKKYHVTQIKSGPNKGVLKFQLMKRKCELDEYGKLKTRKSQEKYADYCKRIGVFSGDIDEMPQTIPKKPKKPKKSCTLDEYQKLRTRQKQAAYARACKKKNAEAFLGAWQELPGTKPTKRVKKVKVPPQIAEVLEEIPFIPPTITTTVTKTKKKGGKKKIPCTQEDYIKASLRTQKRMMNPARCGSDPAFLEFMKQNLKKK